MVTGASGLLGSALLSKLAGNHEVLAGFKRNPLTVSSDNITPIQADLNSRDAVLEIFRRYSPELVINCAAAVAVDRCETDHDYAIAGNQTIVDNLLVAGSDQPFRLIQISTDYVFDGRDGPPAETWEPNPINFYGRTKLLAEEAIRSAEIDATIVRVCALYSANPAAKINQFKRIVETLRAGQSYQAADDLFSNPTDVADLAGVLAALSEQAELPPLLHLAAEEYLSRYDFAIEISRALGLNSELVIPTASTKMDLKAPRPLRAGLSSAKINPKLQSLLRNVAEVAASL
jgi:dTDP-4-dehydrorhamnose reductase